MKRISALVTQTKERFPDHFESSRLDSFSDWFRANNAVPLCLLLKKHLRERNMEESSQFPVGRLRERSDFKHQRPAVEDLANAEMEIIRSVQHEHFKEEIKTLRQLSTCGEFLSREAVNQRDMSLKKTSCMYRLDPYLDADGILRVGGRLRRANMPEGIKQQVVLPKGSHVT